MILKLLRWIFGYMIFEVNGKNVVNFMNHASKNKINLWDIKKINDTLKFKAFSSEYKNISNIIRNNKFKINIFHKKGLPFIWAKYQHRKGVLLGFFIYLLILHTLSLYIWNINISGTKTLSKNEIISAVKEIGIYPGAIKRDIDSHTAKTSIMAKLPDIAWSAVNIQGCNANISIKEKDKTPEILTNTVPCNIKAAIDGQIERIETYNGTSVVNIGDAVVKGQILISGIKELGKNETKLERADGKVWAKTIRNFTEQVNLSQTVKIETGRTKNRYRLWLFGLEIPFYFRENADETYEKHIYYKILKLFKTDLPIRAYKEKYIQKCETQIILPYGEALKICQDQIEQRINSEEFKDMKILEKESKSHQEDGKAVLEIKLRCLENIALSEDMKN
ncbi:MAG: sporulation protein YqfD [Oscillospiraceae bacterium]|jgi:similar to stage IV sporulation protein|nr:sporulation protein YqfD [Oscillospiraceae bacterium]